MKRTLIYLALVTALCGQQLGDLYQPNPTTTKLLITPSHTYSALATVTQSSAILIHTDKGNIRVDCKTGEVELPKDMTITVASFEFWKAIEKSFPQHFKRSPSGPHIHNWGKWSAPEISSHWYTGTRSFQQRACMTCGHAESKVVQIHHSTK